jgi:hypothetical protein
VTRSEWCAAIRIVFKSDQIVEIPFWLRVICRHFECHWQDECVSNRHVKAKSTISDWMNSNWRHKRNHSSLPRSEEYKYRRDSRGAICKCSKREVVYQAMKSSSSHRQISSNSQWICTTAKWRLIKRQLAIGVATDTALRLQFRHVARSK